MEAGEGGGGCVDESGQWQWVCGDGGTQEDCDGVESVLQRIVSSLLCAMAFLIRVTFWVARLVLGVEEPPGPVSPP